MSTISRRAALMGGAAFVVTGGGEASAHTPYKQWVVYRKKHLLLGCHRDDPVGYALAKSSAQHLSEELPSARARVARAPAPSRLASLLATDQLDLAIITPDLAAQMVNADGTLAVYGPIDLAVLAMLVDDRVLVAHTRFRQDHAELVAAAMIGSELAPIDVQTALSALPYHAAAHAAVDAHR
ncbi:MAG: hypothetical protein AAGJ94_17600 [Pseudomonadota bacterium]